VYPSIYQRLTPCGPNWELNNVCFVDPTPDETLDFRFHASSGERAYVLDRKNYLHG